jgi:hypothetical protein
MSNTQQQQQLVEIYDCGCHPQFTYKTKQSFRNHFKSERHVAWQHQRDNQNLKETVVELNNIISSLRVECDFWKQAAIRYKRQYEPGDLLLD